MYNDKQIQEIFSKDLKDLVKSKIVESVKDAGQSITPDEAEYLVSRMVMILKDNYKTFTWGDVCAAFKNAATGKYGKVYKLTVNNIQYWIGQYKTEKENRNREQSGRGYKYTTEGFVMTPEKMASGEFWSWLTRNRIVVTELWPDEDFTKKEMPQCFRNLQKEYEEAKEMEILPALAKRLKGVVVDG